MTLGSIIQKVVIFCSNEKPMEQETKETEEQISQSNGKVKLEPVRKTKRQQHKTFPPEATRARLPSHFKTAPAEITDATSPSASPVSPDSPSMMSRRSTGPLKRAPTIELEENPAYRPQGGPDYLKILAKYKLFGKDDRQGRVVCRFVNTGNIRNRQPQMVKIEEFSAQGNQEFLAHIRIGNSDPPQMLRVDLDTGSADFWVFSTLLKPSEPSEKHTIFDPNKSRTWIWPKHQWGGASNPFSFRRKDLNWTVKYGDGSSATGIVGYDEVQIGDISISKQAVELAKSFSGYQFSNGTADGVLGLAFGHLNCVQPEPVKTPLEMMKEQKLLRENLFTVNLGPECFFTFGFIDEATRAGRDIHWVDVDSRGGFWNFSSRFARVGGKLLRRRGGAAIADTGANLILTHPHIVWMVYERIEGAKYDPDQPGWVYPRGARIPEVCFSVGDDDSCMIVINEHNMHHSEVGNGFIFGAIQENPAYENGGLQFDILGTPFLRQVYAIFDITGERFGVIKKNAEEMTVFCESPLRMDYISEEDEAVEDSVDGSIREEVPRRQSTMRSVVEVDSAIPEEEEEIHVISDGLTVPEAQN